MKPFKLTIDLLIPTIITKQPVTLDALLWHCNFLHCHDETVATKRIEKYLKKTDGVFHASALQFGVTSQQTLIACESVSVGTMREDTDLHPDLFKPTSKKKNAKNPYPNIVVTGGAYRNTVRKYQSYHAPVIVFYGVGDGEAVAQMLTYYVIAIGKNATDGVGEIGDVRVEEIEHDRSFFDAEGQLNRPLPLEMYKKLGGEDTEETQQLGLIPPYRLNSTQPCVVPERIKRIII